MSLNKIQSKWLCQAPFSCLCSKHTYTSCTLHRVSGANCILKLLPGDKEWAMPQRELGLQRKSESKWKKLMGGCKAAVPASSVWHQPALKNTSSEWHCCQLMHFRRPVFSWIIFFNSTSQCIKLTLPLNQESDNPAIHLERNFLDN